MFRIISIFAFSLMLTACQIPQDGGHLPMPKEYLGYWDQYTRDDMGIDVLPDGVINQYYKPQPDLPTKIYNYKVFLVEGDRTYMIVREEDTDPDLGPTIINPRWKYISFNFSEFRPEILKFSRQHCDLSVKDWNLPARVHRQRIQNKECDKGGRYISTFGYIRPN